MADTWSLASGSLPAGLSLSATGIISGTPSAAGSSSFTVAVNDGSHTATQLLSIAISATVSTLAIATSSLPAATVSTAYTTALSASGGTAPYTWSISGGTLPAGLILTPLTGAIAGTPSAAGTASFTVTVTDSASRTATQALSITVSATSILLPNGPAAGSFTTLVYDAEFNGTSLDTTKSYASSQGTVNGITPSASNVSVSGGFARLVLASGNSGALMTTAGSLSQFGGPILFEFLVGMCVEASISFPGPGSSNDFYNFPAFWTTGPNWPSNGEIDIIECYSGTPVSSYHSNSTNSGIPAPSGTWSNAFHTYTCVRNTNNVSIWWDGSLKWSFTPNDLGGPHQIIVNTGTISGFPAAFGAASTVLVDYIRAWTP